jgi:hypothetical protein
MKGSHSTELAGVDINGDGRIGGRPVGGAFPPGGHAGFLPGGQFHPHRCRANMAHLRHTKPRSGLGFNGNFLRLF